MVLDTPAVFVEGDLIVDTGDPAFAVALIANTLYGPAVYDLRYLVVEICFCLFDSSSPPFFIMQGL